FMTTGRRRFLKVDNICNVRDLGGILTADGRKRIRFGLVFRGAEMNGYHQDCSNRYCRIDANGRTSMERAGIGAVLDFGRVYPGNTMAHRQAP
ncbi:MAG: tyrosine-protein phosphatase, partial [Bacteroidales bacterium]|nr:tyrosine-protein phosphatase [Bacteroidales bacterium]